MDASLNPEAHRVEPGDPQRVANLIRTNRGGTLPAANIAHLLGFKDSEGHPYTRACITEALRMRLAPIGADSKGYFFLETEAELDVYTAVLDRRIQGITARKVAVRRAFFDGPVEPGEPLQWVPEPEEIP